MTKKEMLIKQVQRMDNLFDGNHDAFGQYFLPDEANEQGKMKGSARTVHKGNYREYKLPDYRVTPELWLEHFKGDGIGIVPIKPDCTVKFGAIDIDDYSVDIPAVIKKIVKLNLPLVACRTKSGGVHCFSFTKTPVPAIVMYKKLKQWAAVLGYAKCNGRDTEIFPKQTIMSNDKVDIGSWINIPYAKNGNRYCVTSDGSPRSLEEFLDFAESKQMDAQEFISFVLAMAQDFSDAPPCIETLATYGVPDGSRNNFAYNLGVFLKQKFPDTWEQKMEETNISCINPPLTSTDLQSVIKSLRKKDYKYKCREMPLCDFCNVTVCRQRKYGVGNDMHLPEIVSITKIETSPPTWYVEVSVNDAHVKLDMSSEDIQSALRFQKRFLEKANILMTIPKKQEWDAWLNTALATVNTIEVPRDGSLQGQLVDYLEKFCTGRAQAKSKDEILTGRPWTEDNCTYFRMSDFTEFLARHKFNDFKVHQISSVFKGAEYLETDHARFNIKGQNVNVWKIKSFQQRTEVDELPKELEDEGVPF